MTKRSTTTSEDPASGRRPVGRPRPWPFSGATVVCGLQLRLLGLRRLTAAGLVLALLNAGLALLESGSPEATFRLVAGLGFALTTGVVSIFALGFGAFAGPATGLVGRGGFAATLMAGPTRPAAQLLGKFLALVVASGWLCLAGAVSSGLALATVAGRTRVGLRAVAPSGARRIARGQAAPRREIFPGEMARWRVESPSGQPDARIQVRLQVALPGPEPARLIRPCEAAATALGGPAATALPQLYGGQGRALVTLRLMSIAEGAASTTLDENDSRGPGELCLVGAESVLSRAVPRELLEAEAFLVEIRNLESRAVLVPPFRDEVPAVGLEARRLGSIRQLARAWALVWLRALIIGALALVLGVVAGPGPALLITLTVALLGLSEPTLKRLADRLEEGRPVVTHPGREGLGDRSPPPVDRLLALALRGVSTGVPNLTDYDAVSELRERTPVPIVRMRRLGRRTGLLLLALILIGLIAAERGEPGLGRPVSGRSSGGPT